MKKHLIIATLLSAVLAGTVAPTFSGTATAATRAHSNPALFDKTRFVLHLGVGYYAFHHWVWNPYKAHKFDKGQPHRTKDMVKGGIALLFTLHEVKVAYDIAKGSNSKTLKAVVKPLSLLISAFSKVGNQLKKGVLLGGDLTGMNKLADGISSTVGGVKDRAIPLP